MCAQAGERLTTADLPGYFGVGSPVPQPFELDLEKVNRVNAYLLLALGQKGLGNLKAAEACVQELVRLDPYNATLEIYRKLDVL